jgi:hypothetical protein
MFASLDDAAFLASKRSDETRGSLKKATGSQSDGTSCEETNTFTPFPDFD